jgi:spermidine synthase
MTHRSEDALSRLGCAPLAGRKAPQVLVSGLGLGYSLRAALDALPRDAKVTVAELNETVVAWCRGPIATLSRNALADPRVTVVLGDVSQVIAAAQGSYDSIMLDLYEGPHAATQRKIDPFYSAAALARTHRALRPGGVLAVWAEELDTAFERRMIAAGFQTTHTREGRGSGVHVIYLGLRPGGDGGATDRRSGRSPDPPRAPSGPRTPPRARRR